MPQAFHMSTAIHSYVLDRSFATKLTIETDMFKFIDKRRP